MDENEERLLLAIRDAPDDDSPRLAYARWLSQRGDKRGVLIETQCERAKLDEDDPRVAELELREQALLEEHPDLRPDGYHCGPYLHRGFHEPTGRKLYIRTRDFVAHADKWFRLAPTVEWLCVADPHPHVRALAQCSALRRYRGLRIYSLNRSDSPRPILTEAEFAALATCPHLEGLERLDLSNCYLEDDGLLQIGRAPFFARLKELHIGYNARLTPAGLRVVYLPGSAPRALLDLNLAQLSQTPQGVVEVLERAPLRGLKNLCLQECHLEALVERAVDAICASGAYLERLDLSRNGVNDPALTALAGSVTCNRLRTLSLSSGTFSAWAMRDFAASPHLPELQRLSLWDCRIEPGGIAAIVQSQAFPFLTELTLGGVTLDQTDVQALLISAPRLTHLCLQRTGLNDEQVARLAASETLSLLTYLDLGGNALGNRAARALIESPFLSHLRELCYHDNRTGPKLREALETRFGEQVVSFEL